MNRKEWGKMLGTSAEIIHRRSRSLRKKIRCKRLEDGMTYVVNGCNEAVRLTGIPHHVVYNYLTRSRRKRGIRGWKFEYVG